MSDAIRHRAVVDASGDKLRCVEVSEVVDPEARQTQLCADVRWVERTTILANEHEPAVTIPRP
jgi:hypothetical protein